MRRLYLTLLEKLKVKASDIGLKRPFTKKLVTVIFPLAFQNSLPNIQLQLVVERIEECKGVLRAAAFRKF